MKISYSNELAHGLFGKGKSKKVNYSDYANKAQTTRQNIVNLQKDIQNEISKVDVYDRHSSKNSTILPQLVNSLNDLYDQIVIFADAKNKIQ